MVLMHVFRHLFLLMYLITICLCAFTNVCSIFVFYRRGYLCVFSSIHTHLYIFVSVEFQTGISEFWLFFFPYNIQVTAKMKMG